MRGANEGWRVRLVKDWESHQDQIPAYVQEAAEREKANQIKIQEERTKTDQLKKGKNLLVGEVKLLKQCILQEDPLLDRFQVLDEQLDSLEEKIKGAESIDALPLFKEEIQTIQEDLFQIHQTVTTLSHKAAAVKREMETVDQLVITCSTRTGDPLTREKEALEILSQKLEQADDADILDGLKNTLAEMKADLHRKKVAFEAEERRKQAEKKAKAQIEKESLQNKLKQRIKELKDKLSPYRQKSTEELYRLDSIEVDVAMARWPGELRSIEENLEQNIVPRIKQTIEKHAITNRKEQFAVKLDEDIEILTRVSAGKVEDVFAELERVGCGMKQGSSNHFHGLDGKVYQLDLFWTGSIEDVESLITTRLNELIEIKSMLPEVKTLPELENLQNRYEEPFRKISELKGQLDD